jgi:hypothetical protein
MELHTLRESGVVTFELGPNPVALSRLRVADSQGETMWELVPTATKSVPVVGAEMAFVRLPEPSAAAVLQALKGAAEEVTQRVPYESKQRWLRSELLTMSFAPRRKPANFLKR